MYLCKTNSFFLQIVQKWFLCCRSTLFTCKLCNCAFMSCHCSSYRLLSVTQEGYASWLWPFLNSFSYIFLLYALCIAKELMHLYVDVKYLDPTARMHRLISSFTAYTFQRRQRMTKPTKWHVRQTKTQISLGIRPVWSESLLSAW